MARSRSRRSSGRGTRRRSGSGVTALQIFAAVLVTGASAALLGGYLWLSYGRDQDVALDQLGCPVTGATGMTAIIIDATDPISEITMANLKNEFRREVAQVGKGQYLRIASLTGQPRELPMMFDGCNPGDGSSVDQWTNNPNRRQRRWEEEFGKPLEQLPASLDNGIGASQSPVMAAVQKIRNDLFDSDIAVPGSPKRIIIVSDMIEHTDLYSQYRSGADFAAYLASDAYRTFRTTLSDVEVTILYVERANRRFPSSEHVRFWNDWIIENGGRIGSIKRLEGLN
ncbi:hypothetical protein GTW25_19895 [Aliihoeflea aestuarii]|jgi:hypothetical protein|uniref:hypothetical protein n=1 Tax=Aliihoeflea aestuarii TaxID=453840 RepID=UPI0020955328|nr:hypothetical protein [Aliihoeflea aestuarii]MCO6393286.1 hypothetical protein [Aliihoeflea aestuarii]